jgi:rubrerythrin
MAEQFEVSEIVKVAIEDERTGVTFYSALAEKTDKLKDIFADLAEQERHHQRRFEQMLEQLGGHQPMEEYPGQYMAYLQTLTSDRAFPDEQAALRKAEQCKDDAEALSIASRFERDTLILMNEMRGLVSDKHRAVVDELTKEEQEHLVTLAEARKNLAG